jgi:hypothetical protein
MTTLQPGEAARYAAADLRGDGARWTAALGTAELEGAAVTVPTHTSLPLRILVLVDLSGSMAGSGLEVTRSALRSFLFDVPDSVRVAIAPFQSRAVEPGIRNVEFVSRDSAFSLLTALPMPGGNTALYSAAAVGAERLAAEVAAAGPGAWGGLLLITDGANDVGNPGDDPGLLAGPDGRRIATETLGRSGIHAWLIGIGANVSAGELTALGGPGATSLLVGTDPLELARAFAAVQGWLFTGSRCSSYGSERARGSRPKSCGPQRIVRPCSRCPRLSAARAFPPCRRTSSRACPTRSPPSTGAGRCCCSSLRSG